jgi:Helix-turn-helix domain
LLPSRGQLEPQRAEPATDNAPVSASFVFLLAPRSSAERRRCFLWRAAPTRSVSYFRSPRSTCQPSQNANNRRVCSFRRHHGIADYRESEWAERGEITLQAAAQILDVSVMTALRMIRHGIIKGRQLCRGAPWVIKAEDLAAYREQKASRHSLTSNPAQQSFQFQ